MNKPSNDRRGGFNRRNDDRPRKKRKRQYSKVGIEIMSDRPPRRQFEFFNDDDR